VWAGVADALPGRGKRGGVRVIYCHWLSQSQCYLIYAYAKNTTLI